MSEELFVSKKVGGVSKARKHINNAMYEMYVRIFRQNANNKLEASKNTATDLSANEALQLVCVCAQELNEACTILQKLFPQHVQITTSPLKNRILKCLKAFSTSKKRKYERHAKTVSGPVCQKSKLIHNDIELSKEAVDLEYKNTVFDHLILKYFHGSDVNGAGAKLSFEDLHVRTPLQDYESCYLIKA